MIGDEKHAAFSDYPYRQRADLSFCLPLCFTARGIQRRGPMQSQTPLLWTIDLPALQLAVIIPVLNEAGNIEPLLTRLSLVLAGIEWEAVFVDDGSTDGTIQTIEATARIDRRIRLIRRIGRRGLSSAVMEGFLSTVAPVVAVIDGDMQHDETVLPRLYNAIAEEGAELAVGSRYAAGGSLGDWSQNRAIISKFATRLAAPVMKTPLTDPMSGFFALSRSIAIEAAPRLSSVGYKLLLDIVASVPRRLNVSEHAYTFRTRTAGESKLDNAVALEYVELLLDKMFGRIVPAKLILFGAIGTAGTAVHLALLGLMLQLLAAPFHIAQAFATFGAMTFNFSLNNELTYRDRKLRGVRWLTGLLSFAAACGLGAVANVGLGSLLYSDSWSWWAAGIAGAAIGSVWNYVATSWLIWRRR
jgi:dolichol-phosphate mannosyltransferase